MADYQLTDEQADKLNRAMSGQDVEMSDEQASLMNEAIGQSQSQTPVPAQPQPQKPAPLANPNPSVAMDVTGNQFWSGIVNRASNGLVPLAEDAVKGFVKDPMAAAQRGAQAGKQSLFPLNPFGAIDVAKGLAGDENSARTYGKQAEDFGGPGTTVAGSLANPTNLIGGTGFLVNAGIQAGQDQIQESTGQDVGTGFDKAKNAVMAGGMSKVAGMALNGSNSFDDFLTQKIGPAALDWVNKSAQRVVMQGTTKKALVQELKNPEINPSRLGLGSAFDDVKWQMLEVLQPKTLQDFNIVTDRLAKQAGDAASQYNPAKQKMLSRDSLIAERQAANEAAIGQAGSQNLATRQAAQGINDRQLAQVNAKNESIEWMNYDQSRPMEGFPRQPGRFGARLPERPPEPVVPVEVEPQLQSIPRRMPIPEKIVGNMQRTSNLEKIMAPGLNTQMSRADSGGFASTVPGKLANNAIDSTFRRGALATMKTSQAIASKALGRLNMDMNMAPFQRDMVAQKLQNIASMEPSKANAYVYAESMTNPTFRQIWLNAQKEQGENNE